MNNSKRKWKNNSTNSSLKNNTMLRKFNKRNARLVHWKLKKSLQTTKEVKKKGGGKIECIHGSEDFILLRWQHSPNWSTDSTQCLLKFFSHFCSSWQADTKNHMKMQGILNSQNSLEKQKIWSTHISWFQVTATNISIQGDRRSPPWNVTDSAAEKKERKWTTRWWLCSWSVHVTLVHILLAKTSHTVKPEISGKNVQSSLREKQWIFSAVI